MGKELYKTKKGWIGPAAIWWVIVLFLIFVVVYPIAVLILNSFQAGESFSLANYARIFQDKSIVNSMLNSLKVVVPSTLISTVLGVFLAWAVVRTNVPGKRVWKTLLSIPYFIPPFIGAIAWTFLLGPKGFVNEAAMSMFNLTKPAFDVYSIGGMIFVMSIYRFAVPFIVVMPTMQKVSASVEEAARISGASPWKTMKDITLPLLGPSIIGAMLLVFMFLLADFGVSAVLGAPNQIRLMTTEIFYIINRPDMANHLQIAAAYSMLLSVFALIGLWAYNRVLRTNKYAVVSGKSAAVEPTRLSSKAKWILFAVLLVIFLITTCSPIIASLITSLTKVYGVPFGIENFTFANFLNLMDIKNIARAFQNSAVLSVVSALVIMVVTLIIAYIAIRKNVRGVAGVKIMQVMVTLPYALPGTIIALGMILSFTQPLPLVGWELYGTFGILMIAYIARFLNLGYNNIAGAISQIDPSLEEAARISGASQMRTFKDVVIPLLKTSLFSSFFLVLAPTLSEISLSSLLWSVGNETIGTVVYSSQEEGKILRTAALAILLIVIIILLNFIVQIISERSGKKRKKKRKSSEDIDPMLTMEEF
ncbi:MAG: iron ABC transporter permease [Christensenella sp.]|uniref:ABC transporter permease n=1 Tax=Christensenella sp. TaxID=1935934 RepID=UPI002B1EB453|nr:iron ABC transporter permease [Christensenella sp.]MEA5004567.1 iron ABC transporter permease [Christensenella sp.]